MDGICVSCMNKVPCKCAITQRIGPPQAPQPKSLELRVTELEKIVRRLQAEID